MATDRTTILTAYAALEELAAEVAGFDYTGLAVAELLELLSRREVLARSAPTVDHALLAALQAQTTPREIGAKSWADVLGIRLHVSGAEAKWRVRAAADLGPRVSLTGEPLPPAREHIAAAQGAGAISGEHIAILNSFDKKLPGWVDAATRSQWEQALVLHAGGQSPEELGAAADALLFLANQDGAEPDDAEKARKRAFILGRQGADGMSKVSGHLTPEARALLESGLGDLGAPGMANPDDENPCISGTPSQAQIDSDTRSPAQRNHDALAALAQLGLQSQKLGEHNGLPVSVVVTTTLQDLEAGTGMALTHTGTKLGIGDLVNLAARAGANHYLAVFDKHATIPLYLGRARRTATAGQRLVLFARDRGCTRPGCTAPASRCQAHHASADWQHGGHTDITDLALACGCDNRLATDGGWTTTMNNGRAHWTPPPLLDTGQPRTNTYWHPQLYPPESTGDDETDRQAS